MYGTCDKCKQTYTRLTSTPGSSAGDVPTYTCVNCTPSIEDPYLLWCTVRRLWWSSAGERRFTQSFQDAQRYSREVAERRILAENSDQQWHNEPTTLMCPDMVPNQRER